MTSASDQPRPAFVRPGCPGATTRSWPGADLGRSVCEWIVLNIPTGNTDDHARNHAAFRDGQHLRLTPACDLCPQPRTSREADQAMDIDRAPDPMVPGDRRANRSPCIAAAREYSHPPRQTADPLVTQVATIRPAWDEAADATRLTRREADAHCGRQVLNPYALT